MEKNKENNVIVQSLDQIMSDRFGRYSKYIIQARALPDVRDGLKPVQRRILHAMNELGLTHASAYKKSARVVGEVIGKYHPHGDSSIYDAMVRMAQDWKMNTPLIDMHGNKGSIDDDPAAAMRYTEARLAKVAQAILNGIDKKTVKFVPNFDDSEKEPTVLPGLFPNLLVNGAKGIAAGYATEMPPHNLGEVIDGIMARIKNPNISLNELAKIVKGPDFPTGGIVQGADGIYQAFERGQGKIIIRSRYEINFSKTAPSINITEIPFGVVKQKLVKDIDELRFNKKISGLKDVRDESDRNGISIMIELSSGTEPLPVLNYLLAKTDMQVYYNYNNITISDNAPKQLGLIGLIDAYLKHQKDVQVKAIKFDLEKDKTRLEIVEGLIKVATMTDQVIDLIRQAEGSRQGVVESLKAKFGFTDLQSSAIADLRLYRLSRTDQKVYQDEAAELRVRINQFEKLLKDSSSFDEYLIDILTKFKKEFASARKSTIESEVEKIEINLDDLIKHEDTWIGISKQGYIKRVSNRAFEANENKDYSLKDNDTIAYLHKINTIDKLLVFTSKGNYAFINTHLIPECKWKDIGKHINDFAQIDVDEYIIDAIAVNDFNLNVYLALASSDGQIKRVTIKDFEMQRTSKTSSAFKLAPKTFLVAVRPTNGHMHLVLVASNGKATCYPETTISIYGTKSGGIQGISLPNGVTATTLIAASESDAIGLISKRGGMKKMKLSSIPLTSRNTQGKHIFKELKSNPHVAIDGRIVEETSEAIFRDESKELFFAQFKNIAFSSSDDSFDLKGPAHTKDGRILVFNRIWSGSRLITKVDLTPDQKMQKAEAQIEAASQISLDDLLKDI